MTNRFLLRLILNCIIASFVLTCQSADVKLSWDASIEYERISHYKLMMVVPNSNSGARTLIIPSTTTNLVITNLSNGMTYSFSLIAYNNFGQSKPSMTKIFIR